MKNRDILISVGLFLRGDKLDPSEVSKKLGITPSGAQRKGDKKTTSTNKEYIAKIGVWKLIADTDSKIISDHVNQLASTIGTASRLIKDISFLEEAYIDVFFAADADADGGGTCEFEITKEDLVKLANLELPIRFTVTHVRE